MNDEIETPKENKTEIFICNFCRKNNREVMKMIAGSGVCICDQCVALCVRILGETNANQS